MVYQYGYQPSPQAARKKVIIFSTDIANLQCVGKEIGAGGSIYTIDLTTSIGLFSHNPSIGEQWIITQILGLWSLERKTSLQNPAILASKTSQIGDTVFNAPGNLIFVSTNLKLNNGNLSSRWSSNGTDSYITDTSTHVDTWQTYNLTGSSNGGIWALSVDYFITFDRTVKINGQLRFSTAPSAGTITFGSVLPVSIKATVGPSAFAFKGLAMNDSASTVTQANIINQDLIIFGVTASISNYSFDFTYPIPKPTF